jgi:hypothetical protein
MHSTLKKLLLSLIFLSLPYLVNAGCLQGIVGSSGAAASSCTSCTGALVFAAYFEAAGNGDVTAGSPCGCVVTGADTTGTAADTCTIESGYLYAADGGKNFAWDIASDDIFNDATGSILIEFQVHTWVANAELFSVFLGPNDGLEIYLTSTDEILINHEGNNAGIINAITAGASNILVDTTYYVVARWTTADVDPNLRIELYTSAGNYKDHDVDNANLTAFNVAPGAGNFQVGITSANDANIKIYKLKVWNTYNGAPATDASCEAENVPADCCTGAGTGACGALSAE